MSYGDDDDTEMVLDAVAGRRVSSTGWVRADCPLCELRSGRPDKNQCLGLRVGTGFWHCFRCGSAGVATLPDDFEALVPARRRDAPAEAVAMELPEECLKLYEEPGWSSLAADPARAYLRARNVDDDLGHDVGIGVCLAGRHRGRVVVPVLDATASVLLGWSARDYTGTAERKYLYPIGMRRAEILYNHAALFAPDAGIPVMVTEGCFDAISVWPYAVACLGKPTNQQLEALIASGKPVAVCLDGDAWREGEMVALQLRLHGVRAGSVHLPPRKDPNTVPADALVAAAVRCVEEETTVCL